MKRRPLAAIVSAGLSKFGVRQGLGGRELFAEAVIEAYSRCPALDPKKHIQALYVGQFSGGEFEHQSHTASLMADWAGVLSAPSTRVENACASSGVALRMGILALKSGSCEAVMVGGVEKMTTRDTIRVTEILSLAADHPMEQWNGITFPGQFALMATAHMNKYGTTEEHLAKVAVKNHFNGARNPKAHFQKEVSLQTALASRVVAWPLKLYDCSLITDGASCLILTKPDLARKFTDSPVYIIGSSQASDTIGLYERDDLTTLPAAKKAAREAYRMARVSPREIDVAEVHDCFTIAELIAYEDLGFCEKGQSQRLIDDGNTLIEGQLPVNTSGGLKSKGHPVGATGTAQAYEIYLQLTGQAERRQVDGAKVALTHNLGGSGGTAAIHVYRNELG
ncbi:MAG: thiolase domain-containing protein [Candidatus Bathyarchaeia archaeon]